MATAKQWGQVLKETFNDWLAHGAMMHAAALAFYAVLSLAPMLMLVLVTASVVWGEQAAEGQLVEQAEEMMGTEGAEMAETVVAEADEPGVRNVSAAISLVLAAVGATAVFAQLQLSLNNVWGVQRASGTVKGIIKTRLMGLALVILLGLLLLASTVLTSVVAGAAQYAEAWLPEAIPTFVPQLAEALVSVFVIAVLLGLVFKYLPDIHVATRDIVVGAIVASVLFVIGKTLIGLYIGIAGVGGAYGAAGSLIAVLVWLYYSSLVILLGAEFTQVYSRQLGQGVQPAEYAEPTRKAA